MRAAITALHNAGYAEDLDIDATMAKDVKWGDKFIDEGPPRKHKDRLTNATNRDM